MARTLVNHKANFGTMPVFMTTISTILGAILFLRFGYAVGHTGFIGTIGIIVLGHLVTIPTAMAVAEIATNQKVLGGGAYYIISRSFGLNIGASIGIALYLSQAISVAFYIIAFGMAFEPVFNFLSANYNINIPDARFITIPTMAILALIILTRGANLGMKALYLVVALLFTAIILFLVGKSTHIIDHCHNNQGDSGIAAIHFEHQPDGKNGTDHGNIPFRTESGPVGRICCKMFK
ncbi:hypothetical protein ES703_81408 [subsurface metagenome]